MSRVYLMGYYGMLNTGDDALLNVVAWGARNCLKHDDLSIGSFRDIKLCDGRRYKAVLNEQQQFRGQNRLKNYYAAIESQRLIFGGGSTLHSYQDISIKRHMMKLSGGRSHLALGVGIGPFESVKAEKACAKFLNECEYIGVRDLKSYEIAQAISPYANVELTFDLAPQLLLMKNFEMHNIQRSGVAVCLCPNERLAGESATEQNRLADLAKALDAIQYETGELIYFIDFNGHSSLGDCSVHKDLIAMLDPETKYRHIRYDQNPQRVLQRMAAFKLCIGMRLHASIFSFIAETPFISLNYHQKCEQWCKQIGLHENYSFELQSLDTQSLVKRVCSGISDGFVRNHMTVKQALTLSMKNWRSDYESVKQQDFLGCYSSL